MRRHRGIAFDDGGSDEENGECWKITNLSQPNTPHFCRNCMLGFRDRILLNNHLNEHYLETRATAEHRALKHNAPEATFRCLNCKERFHSPEQLKIHCETCQPDDTAWQCDICEEIFDDKEQLNAHFLSMHSNAPTLPRGPIQCPHCRLCFDSREDLRLHIEIDHELESPQKKYRKPAEEEVYITVACECGKVFINELDYQEHILEEHPDTEPLKWPKDINEVKKRRRSEGTPRNKLSNYQAPKRYKRQPRAYDTNSYARSSLQRMNHEGYYDGKEGGCCVECGESFSKTVELKRHMQNEHQHLKPYACSICTRRFTRKSDVKRHIETIHGQAVSKEDLDRIQTIRPFRCAKCGNPFGRYMDIKKHIEMHHGLPFSPDTYVYQLEHMMDAGLAIGSSGEQVNVRTFDCGLCKRKYRNKTTVRHHIRKDHNQEEPDAFITRSHFNHSDDMECQFCGDVFGCIEDKIEHVQNIHQTIVEEDIVGESVPLAGVIQQDIIQRNEEEGEEPENFMPVKDVSTPEKQQRYNSKNQIVILKQEFINPAPLELRDIKKDRSWSNTLINDIVAEQDQPKLSSYDCPECSRTFTRPRALQNHIAKMHSQKESEFECDLCGKSYKQQAQFVKHLQVAHPEVGPKPEESRNNKPTNDQLIYSCDLCEKSFTAETDLVAHMDTAHKPDIQKSTPVAAPAPPPPPAPRPVTPTTLEMSQAVTVNHSPMMEYYTCNICSAMFSSTESLTRHMNVKHKDIKVLGKKTPLAPSGPPKNTDHGTLVQST